jgi:5-methylthioadenosine/S-adenosylhomocysteine deaminase
MRIVIANAAVVTVDASNTVLDRAWIDVRDGAIAAIATEPLDEGGADQVIDATDKVVLPGLVNSHPHLFQTLIRGIYAEVSFERWLRAIYRCGQALTPDDCTLAAQVGCLESLRSGVTTLVDHSFLDRGIELSEPTIRGMTSSGIRSVFARTIIDVDWFAPPEAVETPEAGLRQVDRLFDAFAGEVGPMLTILTGGNTPGASASADMARAATAYAKARGIGQSMHIASNAGVIRSLREHVGRDGVVAWLDEIGALGGPILGAHSVHLSADEIAIMARQGMSVAHNPLSNMFLGDGFAPVSDMLAAGVNVALGSDGAASNNSQDMFEALKIATLLQRARVQDGRAVTVEQGLRMATINGARALGMDHVIGSVEVGKRADLIVVDLKSAPHNTAVHDIPSHLVYSAKSTDVRHVLVDGVLRLQDREPTWIDEGELLARADVAGRAIVSRLEA